MTDGGNGNSEKNGFIHLHCHSDYSLYDGFQKIGNMVKRASELGMKGIAITDHGKIGSYIKFYKAAKKEKIKPVFGIEAYLAHNLSQNNSPRYHLTILAKNNIGYKNILKLSSESHKHIAKVFKNEIPRIDFNMLKENSEGLVILSGCIASEFSSLIVEKNAPEEAEALAKQYKDVWGDDYYIEVMYAKYAPQLLQMKHAEKIAKNLGIKIVATNDAHYSYREEAKDQVAKIALSRNKPYFPEDENSEYYIKSYEEMKVWFNKHRLDYLHQSVEIFDKCNVEIELGHGKLPHFEVPKNNEAFNKWKVKCWRKTDEEAYLEFLAEMGLKNLNLWDIPEYRARLFKELETIRFTGFTRYFLIVWDYCYYATSKDIKLSKGRGSGAGSLVLYCLGVTGVDPIKRSLSMDRFLYAEAEYRAKTEDFFSINEREKNMHGEKCACKSCVSNNSEKICLVA